MFKWQTDKLSKEQIIKIIDFKQDNNEIVGFDLCYNNEDLGVTLLAKNTNEITLAIDIERKELPDRTTDFTWYFNNIILLLRDNGCIIDDFTFEEYMG